MINTAYQSEEDGFAASEVEAGRSRLEGHPLGQPQHVDEGVFLALVRIETSPAEGGTENGVVDGDDGAKAADGILAEKYLLMGFGTDRFEYPQRQLLLKIVLA